MLCDLPVGPCQGRGKKYTATAAPALPTACTSHDVMQYSHGTIDGNKVWTNLYRRPKTAAAGCYFQAEHKLNKRKKHVIVSCLVYCSLCKILFVVAEELTSYAYELDGVIVLNSFVVESVNKEVVLRCSDYVWLSSYFFRIGAMQLFSIYQRHLND